MLSRTENSFVISFSPSIFGVKPVILFFLTHTLHRVHIFEFIDDFALPEFSSDQFSLTLVIL